MSKARRRGTTQTPQELEEEEQKREKKRKWAAEYRKRPEAVEKQRVLMAQRRAAVKAKRRQWDPPKKAKVSRPASPVTEASNESRVSHDDASLTAAEHFAFQLLATISPGGASEKAVDVSLNEGRTQPCQDLLLDEQETDLVGSHVDVVSNLGSQPSSDSDYVSMRSSLRAVNEHPVRGLRGDWETAFVDKLPFYASPIDPLEKKIQRELGIIGPLTGIQQVQVAAAKLWRPLAEHNLGGWDGDHERAPERESSAVIDGWDGDHEPGTERAVSHRMRKVHRWRERMAGCDNSWDRATQCSFAEAALWRHRVA
ncbi:hypothetical protein C8R46DRAFT_1232031 [Mycena filopes]|nr:hypothetical protein C8R46DRAFT_1232031 [Mycena filopes]